MNRRSFRYTGNALRLRPLVVTTLVLVILYALIRPSHDDTPASLPKHQEDRIKHLLPHEQDVEEGASFSPVKALGLDSWVSGKRKSLLILGDSPLGVSLSSTLDEGYELYYLGHTARPSNLPQTRSVHYLTSTTNTLSSVLSAHHFEGILHLGGLGLAERCKSYDAQCEEEYTTEVKTLLEILQNSSLKRWWKGPRPWLVIGEDATVVPAGQDDKSYSAINEAIKFYLDVFPSSNSLQYARAAIVRFSTIYGAPSSLELRSSDVDTLIRNTIMSSSLQYDSDLPPLNLLHHNDALDGLMTVIRRLESPGDADKSLAEYDFASPASRLTHWKDLVEMVRGRTGSHSPMRDLGTGRATATTWKGPKGELATRDLQSGLTETIKSVHETSLHWATRYLADHCETSPSHLPEKKELWRLDGCTVNIAFDRDGFLDYVKCPSSDAAGTNKCKVDNEKVTAMNWDASVFNIRKQGSKKDDRRVRILFEEEKGRGMLGLNGKGDQAGFELYQTADAAQTVFDLEVHEVDSSLRFVLPDGRQLSAGSSASGNETSFRLGQTAAFDARLNILCCPMEGNWPLLQDDYESADIRFGTTGNIPFNSSREAHLCQRAEEAVKYNQAKLDDLDATIRSEAVSTAKVSRHPHDWSIKDLPVCWNDCSSPTVCVYTGSCRCVQAECPRAHKPAPPPPSSMDSVKSGKSALGVHQGYAPTLVRAVSEGKWEDVLLPDFRTYLSKQSTFPSVHVVSGYEGEQAIESASCHNLQDKHCFSADSVLYKALRHLSVPAEQADVIVLPVYQHCDGAKFLLHDVMHHAMETIPGVKSGEKRVALALTHDWGICQAFTWEIWSARQDHTLYPDWILDNVLVWSVMGDYDSPCYRPHQDVVIPARTCVTPSLRDHFGDLTQVMPVRQRPKLVTWSGTYWGTGKSERLRMTCPRGGAGERELIKGGGPQSSWVNFDYMKDLGTARFCPQPKGIAGWSPRVNDAIYAGCIPVLTSEGTHYPFSNALDWTKFSVRLLPTDLDRIEEILAAIPIEKVEELQRNLMLVREGFLYAGDEKPEEELGRRGPMFWALHEAGLKLGVEYP